MCTAGDSSPSMCNERVVAEWFRILTNFPPVGVHETLEYLRKAHQMDGLIILLKHSNSRRALLSTAAEAGHWASCVRLAECGHAREWIRILPGAGTELEGAAVPFLGSWLPRLYILQSSISHVSKS